MIYLDNAATSYPKPPCVLREVNNCIRKYCGNPGRGSHKLALAAADKIYDTRLMISEFLSYEKCENIVFTPNVTYALNLIIKGLIRDKCHCIISDLEHNSVIRPLYKSLEKYGGEVSVFDTDIPLEEAISPLIRSDTKILISTLCSNVTGKTIDFTELSRISQKYKLKLIIDASQYLGHIRLELNDLYFTALCSAGHKSLFGIQGSAFAVINECDLLDTLTEGGSGVETFSREMPSLLPERYEAGTLSTPAIVSLYAGISYLNEIGLTSVEKKLRCLTTMLREELSKNDLVTLYGAENGIISFNISKCNSGYVADALDKMGFATRSGFHCAPIIHEKLGTTEQGAVRVSLSYFNTEREIYELCNAIRRIKTQ